jgi:hypothetical protein
VSFSASSIFVSDITDESRLADVLRQILSQARKDCPSIPMGNGRPRIRSTSQGCKQIAVDAVADLR